jgi:hypothetical protein
VARNLPSLHDITIDYRIDVAVGPVSRLEDVKSPPGWRWWLLKIIMGGFLARQVTLGKGLGA